MSEPSAPAPATGPTQVQGCGLLVLVLIAIGLLLAGISAVNSLINPAARPDPTPTSSPEQSAWTTCTWGIQKMLGLSMSDAQRFSASNVETTADRTYSVKVFYAKQATFYRCSILHRTDGDWQVLSLDVLK